MVSNNMKRGVCLADITCQDLQNGLTQLRPLLNRWRILNSSLHVRNADLTVVKIGYLLRCWCRGRRVCAIWISLAPNVQHGCLEWLAFLDVHVQYNTIHICSFDGVYSTIARLLA